MGLFGLFNKNKKNTSSVAKKPQSKANELFDDGFSFYQKKDYQNAIATWERAAEEGSTKAKLNLGIMYRTGEGVDKNSERAFHWFERAANEGDLLSQCALAEMYSTGEGVEENYEKVLYWYEQAAKQGHVTAQYNCGIIYNDGIGVKENSEKALYWFEKAGENGHVNAQLACGRIYENMLYESSYNNSINADKSRAMARTWYEKAAEQSNVDGQLSCGLMYFKSSPTEDNKNKSLYWLKKAAESGREDTLYNYGTILYDYFQIKESYPYLKRAADMGNERAKEKCAHIREWAKKRHVVLD